MSIIKKSEKREFLYNHNSCPITWTLKKHNITTRELCIPFMQQWRSINHYFYDTNIPVNKNTINFLCVANTTSVALCNWINQVLHYINRSFLELNFLENMKYHNYYSTNANLSLLCFIFFFMIMLWICFHFCLVFYFLLLSLLCRS